MINEILIPYSFWSLSVSIGTILTVVGAYTLNSNLRVLRTQLHIT